MAKNKTKFNLRNFLLGGFVLSLFLCFFPNFVKSADPEPVLVKEINNDYYPYLEYLKIMGNSLYFFYIANTENWNPIYELWKSDGTTGSTTLVKDINERRDHTDNVDYLVAIGGTLFFGANDGTNGKELWKSDGTPAGTVMIKDINPGVNGSSPEQSVDFNGVLYFSANDGVNGEELWKSDGTADGTAMIKDINPGAAYSSPTNLYIIGSTLYFEADNGVNGRELWKSDGTEGGTKIIKDINPAGNAQTSTFVEYNSTLFFGANDGTHGKELWKSDGTADGTVIVRDINSGGGNGNPAHPVVYNNELYFSAADEVDNNELWKTDGTEAKTVKVKEINPSGTSNPTGPMAEFSGELYFSACDQGTTYCYDNELWKTDGTEAGTVQVAEIRSDCETYPCSNFGSIPAYLTVSGDSLYFSANDGTHGKELWKTDGTEVGTEIVKDVNLCGDFQPNNLTDFNNSLYFFAIDNCEDDRTQLWTLTTGTDDDVDDSSENDLDDAGEGDLNVEEEDNNPVSDYTSVEVVLTSIPSGPKIEILMFFSLSLLFFLILNNIRFFKNRNPKV